MDPKEQLAWEARFAKPAAVSAFLAALLIVGGTVVRQVVALADRPDNDREFLQTIDENAGSFLASAFIQSASFLFLAVVLFYLYSATKARKPEFPVIAVVIAVLGPILLAIAGPAVGPEPHRHRGRVRLGGRADRETRRGPARGPQRGRRGRGLGRDPGARHRLRPDQHQRDARGAAQPLHGHHRRDHRRPLRAADPLGPVDRAAVLAGGDRLPVPRPLAGRPGAGMGDGRGGAVAVGRRAARRTAMDRSSRRTRATPSPTRRRRARSASARSAASCAAASGRSAPRSSR